MEKSTGEVREKSGNFVSPKKWEPWIGGSKKISLRDLSVTFHFKVSLHGTFFSPTPLFFLLSSE